MRHHIRTSYDLGEDDFGGRRKYITYFKPGEYLVFNILKFLFFLFIVWPLQIIWLIISLPFRLMGLLYKSNAPKPVKIVCTLAFIGALLIVLIGLYAAFSEDIQKIH